MNIEDLVIRLKSINDTIDMMRAEKKVIEAEILDLCSYNPDGKKTFDLANGSKIRVSAGSTYKLDQKLLAECIDMFPDELVPVRKKVTYELDKKTYEMLSMYPSYRDIADSFVLVCPKPIKVEVL